MRIPFLQVLCFVSCTAAAQHQYRFKSLSVKDGLSQNSITDIFQDSEGYMWFGTQDGLNMFDGYTFLHYKQSKDSLRSLSNNYILDITEDRLGHIWVTTRLGLNRINKKNQEVTRFISRENNKFNSGNFIHGMLIQGDSVYISFSHGVFRIPFRESYPTHQVMLTEADAAGKHIPIFGGTIADDLSGQTLVFTRRGVGIFDRSFRPLGQVLYDISGWPMGAENKSAFKGRDGSAWFAGHDRLYRWSAVDSLVLEKQFDKGTRVMTISEDQNRSLWIGTNNGIYVRSQEGEYKTIGTDSEGKWGIMHPYIQKIYCDKSGLVWVGQANEGIQIYNPKTETFKFINRTSGIQNDLIWAIYPKSPDSLFIGTNQGGFLLLLKSSMKKQTFAEEALAGVRSIDFLRNEKITRIAEFGGRLWMGTNGNGIFILRPDLSLDQHLEFGDFSANTVSSFSLTDSSLWVGTFNGIFELDKNGAHLKSFTKQSNLNTLHSVYVLTTYINNDHELLLGGNYGFSKYDPRSGEFTSYAYKPGDLANSPAFNFVSGFCEDGNGTLWHSTLGGGIGFFDAETNKFRHFKQEDGLASDMCFAIVCNGGRYLWISTNSGISRMDLTDFSFSNFGIDDGLVSHEFAINSFAEGFEGELYFGSSDGMVIFDPDYLEGQLHSGPPRISALKINYKDAEQPFLSQGSIDIYPDQKVISFEFTGLNFWNPEKTIYAYRLAGFDDQWVHTTGRNRIATYSSIPPGEYVFEVKSSFGRIWSPPYSIGLLVHPPFWQSLWFILLSALAGISIVGVVVRFFSQRRLKKQLWELQLREKIQEERGRISRELHDNVGAHITHIIASLDHINHKAENKPGQLADQLTSLSSFGRDTMHQLRETIWVMNQESISLAQLGEKIKENVLRLVSGQEKTRVNVRLHIYSQLVVKPAQAVNIMRIVQEGVTNSLKHACAPHLTVELSENGNTVSVVVADDGVGMDKAAAANGRFGLANIQQRATELGGVLSIDSARGEGTRVAVNGIRLV